MASPKVRRPAQPSSAIPVSLVQVFTSLLCYIMAMTAIDDLILKLIETGRQASAEEVVALIAHVAVSPFATYLAKVPNHLRGLLSEKGVELPVRLPSLVIHWLKRVVEEEQWPAGTTDVKYVADLQKAILHPNVQIWTYRYYRQPFVGFLSPSHVQGVRGARAFIFVAYSPLYSTITTGYQASSVDVIFTDDFMDVKQQR